MRGDVANKALGTQVNLKPGNTHAAMLGYVPCDTVSAHKREAPRAPAITHPYWREEPAACDLLRWFGRWHSEERWPPLAVLQVVDLAVTRLMAALHVLAWKRALSRTVLLQKRLELEGCLNSAVAPLQKEWRADGVFVQQGGHVLPREVTPKGVRCLSTLNLERCPEHPLQTAAGVPR